MSQKKNKRKAEPSPIAPAARPDPANTSHAIRNLTIASIVGGLAAGGVGLNALLNNRNAPEHVPVALQPAGQPEEDNAVLAAQEVQHVVNQGKQDAKDANKPHLLLLLEDHVDPMSLFFEQAALKETRSYTRVFEVGAKTLDAEAKAWIKVKEKYDLAQRLYAERAASVDPEQQMQMRDFIDKGKHAAKLNNMAIVAGGMTENERARLVCAIPDEEDDQADPAKFTNPQFEAKLKQIDKCLIRALKEQSGPCVVFTGALHGKTLKNDPELQAKFHIQAVSVAPDRSQEAERLLETSRSRLAARREAGIVFDENDEALEALVKRSDYALSPVHVRQLDKRGLHFDTQIDALQRANTLGRLR